MRWIWGILLGGMVLVGGGSVAAQSYCGDRELLLDKLESKFEEVVKYVAVIGEGLMELTVAPDGSWTMLMTMPGGPACVIATGTDWQETGGVKGIKI